MLRDRTLAALAGHPDPDPDGLRAAIAAAPDAPLAVIEGMTIAAHPSQRFRAVRFIDAEHLEAEHRAQFARPSADLPELAAVFVDPEEYHFRTFENILPLDRLLTDVPLDLTLHAPAEHAPGLTTFALEAGPQAQAALDRLDDLDLYVPPLNAHSRGGRRLIFHAAVLSEALTAAVRAVLPGDLRATFSHVNPVFRCSRFEPGDARFSPHLDTPYFDPGRGHLSTHTLLLYLTGGQGDPALRVGEVDFPRLDEMTAVLFDQRLDHEGGPYREGRKVFLRTELIFTHPPLDHEPQLGRLFARANYLTGESILFPELSRYTDDCYSRLAAAHWSGLPGDADPHEPFLHKTFYGASFVANGYDYWFPEGTPLAECAALAILDHFNCRIDGAAFRKRARSRVVHGHRSGDWIPALLDEQGFKSPFIALDRQAIFPEPEAEDEEHCCPQHEDDFAPSRSEGVIYYLSAARESARSRILPAAIVLMGEEVTLDPSRFVIRDGRITVLSEAVIAPLNFASMGYDDCWYEPPGPDTFIGVDLTLRPLRLLLPPILFTESGGCIHLMLDFFRNTWMVRQSAEDVPVPRVLPESIKPSPWSAAAAPVFSDEEKEFWELDWLD